MEQRRKLVTLVTLGAMPISEAAELFGVSWKTAYRLARASVEGGDALEDRSRAPHHHPNETNENVRAALFALKRLFPLMGPKKLRKLLRNRASSRRRP